MEISSRVRVRERARLPARCLYRLEKESGGSRGMVGEERACEHEGDGRDRVFKGK